MLTIKIVLLLTVPMGLGGCSDEPTFRQKKRHAIEFFEYEIDRIGQYPEMPARDYTIEQYQLAVARLQKLRSLEEPMMIEALFYSYGPSGDYRPRLTLTWFEDGFSVNGVVISGPDGHRWELADAIDIPRDLYDDILPRKIMFPVYIEGGRPWDAMEWFDWYGVHLKLPVEAFSGPLQVALLTTDGVYTEFVDAHVASGFLGDCDERTEMPETADRGLPLGSEEAQQRQREAAASLDLPIEIECQVSNIHFRLIPAGEFMMGSPASEYGRWVDEDPRHRVRITQPFYMSVTPVTQAQWQTVMGNNPSHFDGNSNHPVERVNWNEAMDFCRRLSSQTGLTFTLPTEAQWEYACRAGTETAYYFGDNRNDLGRYAWIDFTTHPVGQKKPNAWGLYDMHGNVFEWCADWYDGGYYANSPTDDPTGPPSGQYRVWRGNSGNIIPSFCRSAARYRGYPGHRRNYVGFRVVLVISCLDLN